MARRQSGNTKRRKCHDCSLLTLSIFVDNNCFEYLFCQVAPIPSHPSRNHPLGIRSQEGLGEASVSIEVPLLWRCWSLAACGVGSCSEGCQLDYLPTVPAVFAGGPPTFDGIGSLAHLLTMCLVHYFCLMSALAGQSSKRPECCHERQHSGRSHSRSRTNLQGVCNTSVHFYFLLTEQEVCMGESWLRSPVQTERSEVCTSDRGQDSPIQTDLARLIRCLLYGQTRTI